MIKNKIKIKNKEKNKQHYVEVLLDCSRYHLKEYNKYSA